MRFEKTRAEQDLFLDNQPVSRGTPILKIHFNGNEAVELNSAKDGNDYILNVFGVQLRRLFNELSNVKAVIE